METDFLKEVQQHYYWYYSTLDAVLPFVSCSQSKFVFVILTHMYTCEVGASLQPNLATLRGIPAPLSI